MAGNLVKPLLSLYGTEWREHGYGLRELSRLIPETSTKVYVHEFGFRLCFLLLYGKAEFMNIQFR